MQGSTGGLEIGPGESLLRGQWCKLPTGPSAPAWERGSGQAQAVVLGVSGVLTFFGGSWWKNNGEERGFPSAGWASVQG